MPHNITSADKVRAMGLKAYAAAHGWDYGKLASMFENRIPAPEMRLKFKRKDGRPYSPQWFYELKKVWAEETAQAEAA